MRIFLLLFHINHWTSCPFFFYLDTLRGSETQTEKKKKKEKKNDCDWKNSKCACQVRVCFNLTFIWRSSNCATVSPLHQLCPVPYLTKLAGGCKWQKELRWGGPPPACHLSPQGLFSWQTVHPLLFLQDMLPPLPAVRVSVTECNWRDLSTSSSSSSC